LPAVKTSEIEKKLNSFLNYNRFQTKDIDPDLDVKYRNTQKFYDKIQNEKKLILKSISKLEQSIKKYKKKILLIN
jgi:predicted  nucleic acid-binding Zn-ribbon protein